MAVVSYSNAKIDVSYLDGVFVKKVLRILTFLTKVLGSSNGGDSALKIKNNPQNYKMKAIFVLSIPFQNFIKGLVKINLGKFLDTINVLRQY